MSHIDKVQIDETGYKETKNPFVLSVYRALCGVLCVQKRFCNFAEMYADRMRPVSRIGRTVCGPYPESGGPYPESYLFRLSVKRIRNRADRIRIHAAVSDRVRPRPGTVSGRLRLCADKFRGSADTNTSGDRADTNTVTTPKIS